MRTGRDRCRPDPLRPGNNSRKGSARVKIIGAGFGRTGSACAGALTITVGIAVFLAVSPPRGGASPTWVGGAPPAAAG